ncbi:MAG: pilus assembly FimT family protein, partial [Candidatus Omnitrophota bacterium]
RSGHGRKGRGFTLLELAIIMVILGILALVVMPQIVGAIQSLRLNNAANKFAADVRYIRDIALQWHDTYGVEINASTETYSFFRWTGSSKQNVLDPYKNQPMTYQISTAMESSGVEIASSTLTEVRFDAFGTPRDLNGTALSGPATVVLQIGALSRTVRITHQTGFVEIV